MNGLPVHDDRATKVIIAAFRRQMWGMLLAGLVVGFLGMQAIVVRPMQQQVEGLRQQIAAVEGEVGELVGVRDQVRQTNTLLSQLEIQREKVEAARRALQEIVRFRAALQAEAEQTADAVEGLKTLAEMQRTLIRQGRSMDESVRALDELASLQEQVLARKESAEKANEVFADMSALQERVASQGEDLHAARHTMDELADLKTRAIRENADLDAARAALEEFSCLKAGLLDRPETTADAQANLKRLIGLRDSLSSRAEAAESAGRNLDTLLSIESKLAGRTGELVETVKTLELISDFGEEVRAQIQSLEGLRRSLVELAMLESSIGRAVRILEPLSQIANFRRFSETEIRDAARVILEQRSTRLGNGGQPARSATAEPATPRMHAAGDAERLVPAPEDRPELRD